MSSSSKCINKCQSSQETCPKLILSQNFRLCKAKFQKRKFIQRQSREQLGFYKQKMLRLVRKKSSESLDEAEKRIASVQEQLKFQQGRQNIESWIHRFGNKIQQWSMKQEKDINYLVEECQRITVQIEVRNNADLCVVSQAADKIQKICLETIYK